MFRPLKPNEMFEVRLDKMVAKWAGSIEIGVTTHAPSDLGKIRFYKNKFTMPISSKVHKDNLNDKISTTVKQLGTDKQSLDFMFY